MTTPAPAAPEKRRIHEVPGRTTPVPTPKPATPPAPAKKARKSRAKTDRAPTKVERVIAMLSRPSGATMKAIAKDIGWKEDSLRGFFAATLKGKKGLTIDSAKNDKGERVYRIIAPAGQAAAPAPEAAAEEPI